VLERWQLAEMATGLIAMVGWATIVGYAIWTMLS
jgi:hypothetical protein